MDKIMKHTVNLENEINYRLLKAQVAQQTLKRLDKSFKGFFNAVKDFTINPHKYISCPKPPRYLKKEQHNLIYTYQSFQIKQGCAVLEKDLSVKIPDCLLYEDIKQIEIIPRFKYFEVVFVYECPKEYPQVETNQKVMAVDLGLDNLAACTTNGIIKPFIIDGKDLKSINQYYNKQISKTKSVLDKSRPCIKWSKRLQNLTDKRNNKVNDYLHKAGNKIVTACQINQISKIVIGNVSKSINGINIGKINNQNFVNISLGQLISKIKHKAELHNIEVVVTDESYTSKASFVDNDLLPKSYDPENKHEFSGKRVHRGLYKSKYGVLVNADINGSYNILRKSNPEFSFSKLTEKLKEGIEGWLHPCLRLEVS
jgi:putative transposase